MLLMEKFESTNNETRKHILQVNKFISIFISELLKRGNEHDITKLEHPEVEIFSEYTPKLAASTYGSEEYKNFLKEMGVALDHHYKNNRHHPEYHKNGIKDMTLIDIIEMFCDWKAASMRHNNGDMLSSIEKNKDRFKYSDELMQIFKNTMYILENN